MRTQPHTFDVVGTGDVPTRTLVKVFALVFVPLLAVYLLIPNPGLHPKGDHADALTNAVTAWNLGMRGVVILDGFEAATAPEYFRNIGWFVDSPRGPVSQYPPGAAAFGAPFYRLAGDPTTPILMTGTNNPDAEPLLLPMPSVRPGAVAASVAVAGAMGLIAAAVAGASASMRLGVGTGLVGGLATPMWTVAASALWQHGPGAFWVALGVFLASRRRYGWSGLAFAGAVMTRPHLAAIAAGLGLYDAWKERRLRPMAMIGGGTAAGLIGLLTFNYWLWGTLTVTGGYSPDFAENLSSFDLLGFAANVLGALVDPYVGILVISAFIVPLLLRIHPAWNGSPTWVRGAALGGVLYLLIQLKANRYSGGGGFVGYRYPLEPLVACAPLFGLAYPHWAHGDRVRRWAFWILVGAAVVIFFLWWG